MLAQDNEMIDQEVLNISELTDYKRIRDEIWRREDNARIERTNKNAYEQATKKLAQLEAEKDAVIKEKDAVIEEKDSVIEEKNIIIAELMDEIERLKKTNEQ